MAYKKNSKDDIEAVVRYLKRIKKLIMGEPNVYINGKIYARSGANCGNKNEETSDGEGLLPKSNAIGPFMET